MMNVCLYARVSKDEMASDGGLQDPENQLIPMRKYCDLMSWRISKEYIDRVSGADPNRPAFKAMLSEVKQRHFDLILVWRLDRFSREGINNTLGYINLLKAYKTGLKSLNEAWLDTTQPEVAELLLAIMAWMASEERRKISENTKAALAKLKAKGVKLGRPWHKEKKKDQKSMQNKGQPEKDHDFALEPGLPGCYL